MTKPLLLPFRKRTVTHNWICHQELSPRFSDLNLCSHRSSVLIVMMIDHSLADHNECEGQHNCGQICGNTPGSYYCTCRPGYYLSSDLRTCKGNMPVSIHAEKTFTSLSRYLLTYNTFSVQSNALYIFPKGFTASEQLISWRRIY